MKEQRMKFFCDGFEKLFQMKFFCDGFEKLLHHWRKCVQNGSDFVEK